MRTCEGQVLWRSVDPLGGYFWETCGERASAMLTGGCLHEHVRSIPICVEHAFQAQQEQVGCQECFDAGHECMMVTRLQNLSSAEFHGQRNSGGDL